MEALEERKRSIGVSGYRRIPIESLHCIVIACDPSPRLQLSARSPCLNHDVHNADVPTELIRWLFRPGRMSCTYGEHIPRRTQAEVHVVLPPLQP